MTWIRLLAILLLAPWPTANAEGMSVAAGMDVYHSGSPYLELRYSGQRWKHWSAYLGTALVPEERGRKRTLSPRMGVELYETWFKDRFLTGLGITLAQSDAIVSTPSRYQLRFGWRLKNGWAVELVHESNCRAVCNNSLMRWMIPSGANDEDAFNRGYNFVVFRRRVRL